MHGVDSSFHVEIVEPYIIFKTNPTVGGQPVIHGLWLENDNERKNIFDMLLKCVKAQSVQTSQTVFQEKKVEKKSQNQNVQQNQTQIQQNEQNKESNKEPGEKVEGDFLTPAMILGEKNVPRLGRSSDSMANGQTLDLNVFKQSLRELIEDDAFLLSLHSKYSALNPN